MSEEARRYLKDVSIEEVAPGMWFAHVAATDYVWGVGYSEDECHSSLVKNLHTWLGLGKPQDLTWDIVLDMVLTADEHPGIPEMPLDPLVGEALISPSLIMDLILEHCADELAEQIEEGDGFEELSWEDIYEEDLVVLEDGTTLPEEDFTAVMSCNRGARECVVFSALEVRDAFLLDCPQLAIGLGTKGYAEELVGECLEVVANRLNTEEHHINVVIEFKETE